MGARCKITNNEYVDTGRLNELKVTFETQIEGRDEATRESIENGIHDFESNFDNAEYKNAFINWYAKGFGGGGRE